MIEDGKDPVSAFWRKPAGPVFPWSDDFKLRRTGKLSNYDEYGNLVEMGVTDVGNMYAQLRSLVLNGGFVLSEALSFFTSNPAKALELFPKKGCIAPGADADLLLMGEALALDTVIARGRVMMEAGELLVKGTYETF